MIFQSFLLGNLVSLCMKIINSVVLVGLYYGFLTTFSIGPSYLFLLRAQVMEEGSEKKVSATTGFITGQLLMFISIYYAPLHLALGRPHTITVLALPYILFHFFWNNHKHFFDYGSTTRNSMRNFSIQCVFLNNLIFQLLNHFILPSSMLARLVNIYMFRCNNKMLFVTSSFVGWLIGHILFMKWLGLVLVWIRQNPYIRSNKYIRCNKYLVSELINSMSRIFSILLFITCVYYLGRIPSPIFTKKLKETPKMEQKVESEEEILVNGKEDEFHLLLTETGYKKRPIFEESYINLININENNDNSRFKIFEKKTENSKDVLLRKIKKTFLNILFDSKRWNRPFRYIKNNNFSGTFRNEMSQYFFQICKSDGKEIISFTYLPSLSIFLKMIKKSIYLTTSSTNKLPNPHFYKKKKGKKFNNVFINKIEALDKECISLNILETRTRLCNDDCTKEYISKIYDPLLNKSYKKKIYKKIIIENLIEKLGINRIHGILISNINYHEFEKKKNIFDIKKLSTEIVDLLTLLNRIIKESVSTDLNCNVIFLSSEKIIVTKIFKYLLTQIVTDVNHKKIFKKSTIIKEISKKVLRWSYKLITELEQQSGEYYEDAPVDHEIRSRKFKDIVIFKANKDNADLNKDTNTLDQTDTDEMSLIHYSQQSDFKRDLIKGSMRSQRRKLVIYELFQANVHSSLFLDRIPKNLLFSFYIFESIKLNFINWILKKEEVVEYTEDKIKKKEKNKIKENAHIELAESWDNIPFAQGIRGYMLLTQSILRKYIILPAFIIAKNIIRIFLFQLPEWSEDFQEWDREVHVKCTYNGVPLSETEFPKNWLTDGIQIKILFPFYLKPWKKYKLGSSHKDIIKKKKQDDFFFLTVWGMESELPFDSPRKRLYFFKPIFIELKKKMKELLKVNPILLFRLIKVKTYESRKLKKEKYSLTSNNIIHESSSQIPSPSYTNYSLTEKKKMNLVDRKTKILNKIKKDKKKVISRKNIIINYKKINYNAKILEKRQILQRTNDRLICKLPFFFKFFIESIYINILLSRINIMKKNTEFFFNLKKKFIDKSIYKNDNKKKKISTKNKNPILFISKSLNNISNSEINSHTFNFYDLSYASQAYVFYKLSQIKVSNYYKLRSVLHYKLISFFIKRELKDFFKTKGVIQSKSKFWDNKLKHSKINKWKTWLKGHYQYNLSHIKWSRLTPLKWRNIIYQRHKIKILNKHQSYEKDPVITSKKKELKIYSLFNKKENYKKDYIYNLLSYKFLNYENKTEYFFYKNMFKGNKKQDIYYMSKETFFGIIIKISINNYINNNLRRINTLYMQKKDDIKYFNGNLINFYLRQKLEIEDPTVININRKKNTQIHTNNYPIIYKKNMIPEKNLPNYNKGFLNWMGMNKKILKYPISNLEFWFFPEFGLFYNTYKKKPWLIPSKLLLLNLKNNNENKNFNEKLKFFIELKKKYKKEKDSIGQGNLVYVLSQKKNIEENHVMLDMKKGKKKKQYKNKTEAELDFFLKRYLLFQLRWGDTLNQKMINNIKIYCLLLRLIEPKKITISSIYKREMSLDIMLIKNNLTLTELIKKGVLIIEPIRLYKKKDGRFFMYQTISISLIHQNKHQNNKNYQKQIYGFKNKFYKAISTHQRITKNINKGNFYLLFPENILSFRHRRKLRILFYLNSNNTNDIDRNTVFCNEKTKKNNTKISSDNKNINKEKNKLIALKHFIWPNYRLEDLACMNRYWFNTNNGSRFSMLRVHMYP
uniref:Protein TIC 214 n=1 Tax=Aphyllon epigalium subsp. epigalium TaxID=2249432 RepID=A0A386AWI8_9LAMI|nr:hypothetical protein [Aphyllon epigalium subsp. epigalium]